MKIGLARPDEIAFVWPKVWPYLERAWRRGWSEYYGEWDIKRALIAGEWCLWVATDEAEICAAVVTKFSDFPRCRICEVPLVGGKRMKEWLAPMIEMIERFAVQRGAVKMVGLDREGWIRAAGYRESGRFLEKGIGA